MRVAPLFALLVALASCTNEVPEDRAISQSSEAPGLHPTRGVILISLDTLRADRLGAYGYDGGTSPFLDQLAAERGVVFERVVAQYPGTLISHMSMLTGLYPREHGVLPPASVLAPEVPLLAEMLSEAGVTTAGHTEGGFMDGDFGFARGFDQFTDTAYSDDRDVERTFNRGLEFLTGIRGRQADPNAAKPFFLFLHTYSIHDPYTPPPGFGVDSEAPLTPPPTGEVLKRANRGFLQVPEDVVEEYSVRYDASIRYVDSVLRSFFGRLDELDLTEETAVIITSDHGEAFGEHGSLGHEQTYPEELLVPLILVHPDIESGLRVREPVELIGVAPTVLELAGVQNEEPMSGRSLLSRLVSGLAGDGLAHAENADPTRNRVLLEADGDRWWMLIATEYLSDPDGAWLPLDHSIDVQAPATAELVAFDGPKQVEVVVDGEPGQTAEVGSRWTPIEIGGSGRRRVTLATDSCSSPRQLGTGDDPRCLSLKLGNLAPRRLELYDLAADPAASDDLSWRETQHLRRMLSEVEERQFEPRADGQSLDLDEETRETLEALGYL